MFSRKLALCAFVAALGVAGAAQADTNDFIPKHKGLWLVNVRVTDVMTTDHQHILTGAGADTGLQTRISDSLIPSASVSYFLTDNVALDLIVGTSHHDIFAVGPGTDVLVHRTWVLPPTLSLQYHFLPKDRISPYVGAGVNYMLFYSGQNENGFTVHTPNGFGASLEGGVDYAVSQHANINLDLKKIFYTTDASINGGAFKSHVNLDPWVPSVGVGWKF
jgi:outer membrane protein